jgi:serine/threonine-protein kinase
VTFWSRFRKAPPPNATTEAAAETADVSPEVVATDAALARLALVGANGGPGDVEALALFRSMRSTPEEGRAIEVVRAAMAARALSEPLRVATAGALSERGEPGEALATLAGCSSPAARVLAADLRAERGELPEAIAILERVLVTDLDYPGARERHARWRAALGLAATSTRPGAAGATLVAREPDAPFVLLREVARGGAGVVYEAEDRELGRRVALKVYHHVERDRAQLLHEARVAAALAGKGVVRVLDVDPDEGWLALEWAALGALRGHIRDGDAHLLSPVARWALPLAEALARVHAAGWVHHDVKPANVLFASIERPLLADFGTARRAREPSPPGSLGYVSPERLAGRASDPRDDVFGFGRILEDALHVLGEAEGSWRALAAACCGPDANRPGDGGALVQRVRVEAKP